MDFIINCTQNRFFLFLSDNREREHEIVRLE